MSGARAEGPRCNTEILINRRLLSETLTEERLKGGWPSVLWFLASFVPQLVNIHTSMWIEDFILFSSILCVKPESVLGTVSPGNFSSCYSLSKSFGLLWYQEGSFSSNSSAIDVLWMKPWSDGTFDMEFSNLLLQQCYSSEFLRKMGLYCLGQK